MVSQTRIPEVPDEELFDDSSGYEDDQGIAITRNLTEQEKRQAAALYRLFKELWGLCIVRGEPGAGKDTFLNWFLYTVKRYFPEKRVLRDEKPRPLFGRYAGIFNEERIQTDLAIMREVAKGTRNAEGGKRFDGTYMAALEKAAGEWVTNEGTALLQNSVVGLTEYWKYVYNREPHNPMNKTMGGIHKMARHINTLIVGCIQQESDLDRKTCKPFVNWRVTCTRSRKDTARYIYLVDRVRYDKRQDTFAVIGKTTTIPVDAGRPRSFIGDGKIVIRKPNYVPETDEEALVMNALRMGIDDYDTLVDFLDGAGDMPEVETLLTLKDLCLRFEGRRPKFAIWYPCYYFIFNSRSAPSMTSKIKVGD